MKQKIKKEKKISDSTLRKLWRECLLIIYNNKCAVCGEIEGGENLQCHHIIPRKYVLTRWDLNNGIVVCKKCHRFLHTLNGIAYLIENYIGFKYLLRIEKEDLTTFLKQNKTTTQQHFKQQHEYMKKRKELLLNQRGILIKKILCKFCNVPSKL